MFADDVATGGAKNISDKKDIHWKSLHGSVVKAAATGAGSVDKRGNGKIVMTKSWLGVVAFLHGTEWTVSTERAGVGGVGERAGCDAYLVGDCRGAERERCDGAEGLSAAA